ncbi:MAG: GNAT family N-acetyltransferase [Chloroflexi bacterium]|nr:GNAT family N-acetyltransferase [Chloroflexota bacterium]
MITIKTPTTRDDFKAYYALRYKVLREPWGHPKGTEKDDYEPISEHFMAVNEKGEVVGVAKLYEKSAGVGHISHLAVSGEHHHQGIGHLLVRTVEARAKERGFHSIGSMARVTATKFFEKYGYRVTGIPSLHFGTTHLVWMEKELT